MKCKAIADFLKQCSSIRKTKMILMLVALLGVMSSGMAQVPNYVPANGLVGWWPFNGNANDESGNGNNGTVNGATLTADRNGNANTAYSFDGVSSFIQMNGINYGSSSQFSISVWVNLSTSYPGGFPQHYILDNGTSIGGAYLNTDIDEVQFCCNSINNSISIGTWHNYIGVKNGNLFQVYLDGVFLGSQSGCTAQFFNNLPLYVGKSNVNTEFTNGRIDDIGIWNRALTQQEITNLYTASTPPPCNPLAANLMNGLVGYWPFCGNANDESGNGNNGTVNGATLTADRNGNANSAYSLNGIDNWIQTNSSFLHTDMPHTISIWWLTSDSTKTNQTLFNTGPHTLENLAFHYSSSNPNPPYGVSYGMGNGLTGSGSWNIMHPDNGQVAMNGDFTKWHNCIWVKDSTYKWSIYIDGVLSNNFISSINTGSQLANLRFGAENNGVPTGGANFKGSLDDICIWNRALTQNEITQLYSGSPCVNYQVITVTDTLIINANLTGINPVTFQNSIKVYPNPSSTQITIDFGSNYSTMAGYTMRIQNAMGQMVYSTSVTQQQFTSNLSTWTGNGIYFVYLIDAQGNTVDVKKIILQ
jgi:hypothetical protein